MHAHISYCVYILKDCLEQFRAESDEQSSRITFIELQNKYLRREVKLLKTKLAKNGYKIINQMDEEPRKNIDTLLLINNNALMTTDDTKIGKHHQQQKRAAQLTTPLMYQMRAIIISLTYFNTRKKHFFFQEHLSK